MDVLFTKSDAAKVLQVAESTVLFWAEAGILPPVARTPNGTRLFSPREVEKLAASRAERGLRHQ